MSNIYIIGDKDYLMHHGIKGQKWGVENGPPYPLNPQKDYSKAEQKANAENIKKYIKNRSLKDEIKDSFKDPKDQKHLMKINVEKKVNQLEKIDDEKYNILEASEWMRNPETKEYYRNKIEKIDKRREKVIDDLVNKVVGEYGDMKISFWKGTVGDTLKDDINEQIKNYNDSDHELWTISGGIDMYLKKE